jgi:hypothetical protein
MPEKESAQVNPSNEKPPKLWKAPVDKPDQLKPEDCWLLHSLFVLEGQEKAEASVQP